MAASRDAPIPPDWGGRLRPGSVAAFKRNQWQPSPGIGGRLRPESVATFDRNTQPYQQALETEAAQRNLHLSLQGLLSHLPSKNAEDIATFVDIERQVIQAFIGTAPWDHRLLLEVLGPHVVHRL